MKRSIFIVLAIVALVFVAGEVCQTMSWRWEQANCDVSPTKTANLVLVGCNEENPWPALPLWWP